RCRPPWAESARFQPPQPPAAFPVASPGPRSLVSLERAPATRSRLLLQARLSSKNVRASPCAIPRKISTKRTLFAANAPDSSGGIVLFVLYCRTVVRTPQLEASDDGRQKWRF